MISRRKGRMFLQDLLTFGLFFIYVEYVHHYNFTICLTIYRMVFNDLQDDSHAFRQTPVFTLPSCFLWRSVALGASWAVGWARFWVFLLFIGFRSCSDEQWKEPSDAYIDNKWWMSMIFLDDIGRSHRCFLGTSIDSIATACAAGFIIVFKQWWSICTVMTISNMYASFDNVQRGCGKIMTIW